MIQLRETNDSLLAEIQSLKMDLDVERKRYYATLNRLNKCLRTSSELQIKNDRLQEKLDAMRGIINEH